MPEFDITKTQRYQEFKRARDVENILLATKARKRANASYNKGVREALGFWNAWKYPLLKRREL